ncbi:MAG: aminopeptidase P family protein [Verrucomicrobia bacterium]|nr:aminopeptidase P family protein [Verrucomicrobiota bacterium]
MDQERIKRIKTSLRAARLDALVLRLPENIVMTCGVWPMNGFSYAVVTASDGPVALVAPSCEDEEMGGCWAKDMRFFIWPRLNMPDPLAAIRDHLQQIARQHGLTRARLGYEGSFEWVAPAHNAGELMVACESSITWLKATLTGARWSDATSVLNELRATKTKAEIARLRVAHQVAAFGLETFMRAVRPGMTEAELAASVYRECLTRGVTLDGVRHVNVYPQISSGPNAHRAWRPIVTTGRRKLKAGEIALLELAVCADGFWADTTRVKVAGQPTAVQRRAFEAVKAAQAAATKSIKAGVPALHPDKVASDILKAAGFADEIVHLTGHGLGFRYHEPEPFLVAGNEQKLRAGHVCSVEPGLYSRAWGGIRIEDNVAVTPDGVEILTNATKQL